MSTRRGADAGAGAGADPRPAKRRAKGPAPRDGGRDAAGAVLHEARQVWEAFGLPEAARKNLPGAQARASGTVDRPGPKWSALVQAVFKAAVHVAEILLPGEENPQREDLFRAVARKLEAASAEAAPTPEYAEADAELLRLAGTLASVCEAAPKGSVQGRVARACLVKGVSARTLSEIPFRVGGATQGRAYQDINRLLQGDLLESTLASRASSVNEAALREAVAFMLAPPHAGTFAWATREFVLADSTRVRVPLVLRRRSMGEIYASYAACTSGRSTISRSSFYRVLALLTIDHADDADFGTGDIMVRIRAIISDFASNDALEERLTKHLESALWFLEKDFVTHAVLNAPSPESVPTHDFLAALSSPQPDAPILEGKCKACDFADFFVHELRDLIASSDVSSEQIASAAIAVDHASQYFLALKALRVRQANQQKTLRDLHEREKVASSCEPPAVAIVAIDGMGQHQIYAAQISYYRASERIDVFLDQICIQDAASAALAVSSRVEALLHWVAAELPFIRKVVLQAHCVGDVDFARLVVLCPLLNAKGAPVKVDRVFRASHHDAIRDHYAKVLAHVKRFMRRSQRERVRAILTPDGIAAALAWDQGVPRASVQLLRLANRPDLLTAVDQIVEEVGVADFDEALCAAAVLAPSGEVNANLLIRVHSDIEAGRSFRFSLMVAEDPPTPSKPAPGTAPQDLSFTHHPDALISDDEVNDDAAASTCGGERATTSVPASYTLCYAKPAAQVRSVSGVFILKQANLRAQDSGDEPLRLDADRPEAEHHNLAMQALQMAHDLHITEGPDAQALEPAHDFAAVPRAQGWARQAAGPSEIDYTQEHAEEIRALYKSLARKGPVQVLKALRQRHPHSYTLPTLDQLRRKLPVLLAPKFNENSELTIASLGTGRGRPTKIPDGIVAHMQTMLTSKPADMITSVRERFPDLVGTTGHPLSNDQLRRKFKTLQKKALIFS